MVNIIYLLTIIQDKIFQDIFMVGKKAWQFNTIDYSWVIIIAFYKYRSYYKGIIFFIHVWSFNFDEIDYLNK